jgi:hypothetical protein
MLLRYFESQRNTALANASDQHKAPEQANNHVYYSLGKAILDAVLRILDVFVEDS